jgi:hypothetical protein
VQTGWFVLVASTIVGFVVAKQVAIKTNHDLWITQPERTAMSGVLVGC